MMKNIFASTSTDYENYPAYASLNELDSWEIALDVRSAEAQNVSRVILRRDDLIALRDGINNFFLEGIGHADKS